MLVTPHTVQQMMSTVLSIQSKPRQLHTSLGMQARPQEILTYNWVLVSTAKVPEGRHKDSGKMGSLPAICLQQ